MPKVESPYEKSKSRMTRKGCTINDLKGELRKQFKSRIKDMRKKLIDSNRKLTPADVEQGYHEFAGTLQQDMHNIDHLIQPDEVFKLLKDIQAELVQDVLNNEACDHEDFIRDEIDAIVGNLFTCNICERYSERDICDTCSSTHFGDDNIFALNNNA